MSKRNTNKPKLNDGAKAVILIVLCVLFSFGIAVSEGRADTWQVNESQDMFTDERTVFASAFTDNEKILSMTCAVIDDKTGKKQVTLVDVAGWQPVAPVLRKFRVDQNLHHEVFVERDGIAAVARIEQFPRLIREMKKGAYMRFQALTTYDRPPEIDRVSLKGFPSAYRAVKENCN